MVGSVLNIELSEEIEKYYAKYSHEVLSNRAIPDVRDGLKPVQRRILYSMFEEGLYPNKSVVKSATVVGSVMGKYHPHGDSSIYDALVRMAVPHVYNVPLIHPHGNFGTAQTEAASYRYTECKLSNAGMKVVEDTNSNTVVFKPGEIEKQEPEVLPTMFPNLLVNGSSGIAVAMATSIAPHNLKEVILATLVVLDNYKSVEEYKYAHGEKKYALLDNLVDKVLEVLPAPDFPTGGEIIGYKDGVRKAFTTGSGSVIMKPKYRIVTNNDGSKTIVFYEIPYGCNPTNIVVGLAEAERQHIAFLNSKDKNVGKKTRKQEGFIIDEIIGINDSTDLQGVKIEVTVSAKTNPEKVVMELLQRTGLQSTFSYNMNALVGGVPKTCNIVDILDEFIMFRKTIIVNKSKARIKDINSRLHLIDALIKVLVDVDKAYKIIRMSATQVEAIKSLRECFDLDEVQAKYILDTQLKQLTKQDVLSLQKQAKALHEENNDLSEIVDSEIRQEKVIRKELKDVLVFAKKHGFDERKSVLNNTDSSMYEKALKQNLGETNELDDQQCFVCLHKNKIGAYSTNKYPKHSILSSLFSDFVMFDNNGVGYRQNVSEFQKPSGVKNIVGINNVDDMVIMFTTSGVVGCYEPNYPVRNNSFNMLQISSDTKVCSVTKYYKNGYVVFVTSLGQCLVVDSKYFSPKATIGGKGVAGIKLTPIDSVIYATCVDKTRLDDLFVYVSNGSIVKSVPLREFTPKGRNTGGMLVMKADSNSPVIAASVQTNTYKTNLSSKQQSNSDIVCKRTQKGTVLLGVDYFGE